MTDASKVGVEEFENAVKMMKENNKLKDCLDYIETKIDQLVVLNNTYLFDTKLFCLGALDRKMDAFMEAKASRADNRPLTSIVSYALGSGYLEEGDYIKAYFYFKHILPEQLLSKLATEIEKEAKRKLCEEKYEECLDYINKIDQDVVFSSVEIVDCKLKCLMKLDQKKKAIQEAQAFLGSGSVLSSLGFEIIGSSYASKGNYDEARKHYLQAINVCSTREEKTRCRSLLNSMEKEEERRKAREEDKRETKINPSFLKSESKRDDKKLTTSSKKKKKGAVKKFEGDSKKEEKVEAIIKKLEGDLCGECDKSNEAKEIKKIGVTNQQVFSSTLTFSVELYHNGIFNVIKEDHFKKFAMSLVKANKNHLENLDLLKSWGYDLPYMMRVESALPSGSISPDPLLVVERIQPLHVFFTAKKEEFLKKHSSSLSKESDWWESIKESFRLIFRDIICGLFFLHSSNRVCANFNDSFYVNKEGRGKILHNFAKDFSHAQAQEDVKNLAWLIEFVITDSTCQHVDSQNLKCHFELIKDKFNLPHELIHFLVLLNTKHKYVAQRKLSSSWLIDHPYFWNDEHRITFMKLIKDMTRLDWILESAFDSFEEIGLSQSWPLKINNDLLREIFDYKKSVYRNASSMVLYFCAVYSNINDSRYKGIRGSKKFSDIEIESLLRFDFPEVYNGLFEALCVLQVQEPMRYTKVVKKLSSCCRLKIDGMCLQESR